MEKHRTSTDLNISPITRVISVVPTAANDDNEDDDDKDNDDKIRMMIGIAKP